MPTWRNWSGSVRCEPHRLATPADEAEVARLVAGARGPELPLRAVGSGHSYSPLVETTGTIVSLDRLQGVLRIDADGPDATIAAGTKLHTLGQPLRAAGLAILNQGDVDYQAVAGALATGTHGTGLTLASLSAGILGLRLVTADGSVIDTDASGDGEVLRVGRVHLGCLGVVTALRLRLRPAYRLRDQTCIEPLEEALEKLPDRLQRYRHVECWWFPHADVIGVRTMAETTDRVDDRPFGRWLKEAVVGNRLFGAAAGLSRLPGLAGLRPGLSRVVARLAGEKPYVDWSDRVLATGRTVLANEMEYAVPAEQGPAAIRAVRDYVRSRRTPVLFPIEFRYVAADDIPLSPFYQRTSAVLSIHQDARVPSDPYFRDVERLLLEMGGRPHWGKLHTLTARELEPMYPEWAAFQGLRAHLDPTGKFLTPYLRRVLGA